MRGKSGFYQPGGVKPVEPAEPGILMRQMAGQGPQFALRRQDFLKTPDLTGVDRGAAHAGIASEKR
jgi:hypothetical protein